MRKNKIAVALGLLLAPAAAFADPVSAIIAISTVLVSDIYIKVALIIAGAVYSSARARRMRKKAEAASRRQYNASLQDRSVTTLRSIPPVQTVYGRCITGGFLRAIFTTDKAGTRTNGSAYTKPDALKHLVISFADHQCQALNEVYIDGVAIGLATVDGNGWVTTGEFMTNAGNGSREITLAPGASSVQPPITAVLSAWDTAASTFGTSEGAILVAGSYTLTAGNTTLTNTGANPILINFTVAVTNATVRVSYKLGTPTQTVDTYLNGVAPSQWTSAHRLRGIGYAVITLDLENQRFQGGPPNITFDVSGKLLYDPRTATTVFSRNPALAVRDYLLGEHGYDCETTEVDDTYVIAAANACDVLIDLNVGGIIQSNQPKYTCDGVTSTEDDKEAILSELAGAMCGQVHYGAKWLVQAGAWTAPVMDLSDDDLQGQISIQQADDGLDEVFNSVRGTFIASDKATPSDMDEYINATFVADDGQPLWEDIALLFTNNKGRARNIARIILEQSRNGQVILFPAKLKALPLQIGDRVRVSSAEYGFSLKTYRVTDWQCDITSAVGLTLQEDDASIYDEADAALADPTPNTNLPSPWFVAAVSGLAAFSDTFAQSNGSFDQRIRVSWNAVVDAYVTASQGRVVVVWRRVNSTVWSTVEVAGDDTSTTFSGPKEGDQVIIGVYAKNSMNVEGPRAYIAFTVPVTQFSYGQSGLRLVMHGTSGALSVRGNEVTRVAAVDAWNAGVYSPNAITGPCVASAIPSVEAKSLMFGLNTDPTTDASYTSIDYAIYINKDTGNVGVYESGVLVNEFSTWDPGDRFDVVYTGRAVEYRKNGVPFYFRGAPSGQTLFFDSSMATQGAVLSGISFYAISAVQSGNLLDPGVWLLGTTGSQGVVGDPRRFVREGSDSQNSIIMAIAPDGAQRPAWRSLADGSVIGNGGFRTSVPIDTGKSYRFSVWFKCVTVSAAYGSVYLGPSDSSVADIPTGTVNANPYFAIIPRETVVTGRWYLFVGYVFAAGYGTTGYGVGGVYDGATGQKVAPCTDYKAASGINGSGMRCYSYYANSGNDTHWFDPRIDLMDGNERTLDSMLALSKAQSNILPFDFATAVGVNGQFTNWELSSPRPDGWVDWANGLPIKETSIVRTGPNATRYVVGGSTDNGIQFVHSFGTAVPQAGSFLRGTFDIYLATNTAGGRPGYLFRLYIAADLSAFRDTLVQAPSGVTGAWQRVPFSAAVRNGESIYRINIYQMASWSGFSGGRFTGDVIFDSLEIDLADPADTLQIHPGAATPAVLSSSPTDGNHSWAANTPPYFADIGTLTWVNDTGRTAEVEVSYSGAADGSGGGGTRGGRPVVQMTWSETGGGSAGMYSATLTTVQSSVSGVMTASVPAGQTITFTVRVTLRFSSESGTVGLGTMSWEQFSLRLTAIVA